MEPQHDTDGARDRDPGPDADTGVEPTVRRWQLQEAKQRFSELMRHVEDGEAQVVTRHGRDIAVVVSMDAYRRIGRREPDFRAFFAPIPGVDPLEVPRDGDLPRDVVLG